MNAALLYTCIFAVGFALGFITGLWILQYATQSYLERLAEQKWGEIMRKRTGKP